MKKAKTNKKKELTSKEKADKLKEKNEIKTVTALLLPIWNIDILIALKDGPLSKANIQRATMIGTTKITDEVLGGKIKMFIREGIVEMVDPAAPYIVKIPGFTVYGLTLLPLIEAMRKTGEIHLERGKGGKKK